MRFRLRASVHTREGELIEAGTFIGGKDDMSLREFKRRMGSTDESPLTIMDPLDDGARALFDRHWRVDSSVPGGFVKA
jgi:hypothetical protein